MTYMNNSILTETLRKSGAAVCDKIKQMFLNGECDHLTANDLETWMQLSNPAKYYAGYEAMRYMGMSQTKFYQCRKAGIIGDPVKLKQFNKPLYSKAVLDKALETLSGMTDNQVRIAILAANKNSKDGDKRRICIKGS